MSSRPSSPSPDASLTLPLSSPPFTPVRNASKKLPSASLSRDASSRPALALVTPNQTPLGQANRFGVLASSNRATRLDPKTPSRKPRVPFSASNSPVEENWRSSRKRGLPPTPTGATDLLPAPFHSTQRRVKNSQNQNASQPFTPARPKKIFALPTPGESPVFSLAAKPRVALDIATPARPPLPIFLPETPVSPVDRKVTLPLAAFDTEPKPKALCAACSRTLTSAALLSPCSHLVCSQCFTGSLNVAGEKPMDCMACKMPIGSFRLTSAIISTTGAAFAVPEPVASVAEGFLDTASFLAGAEINTVEMLAGLSDEPTVLRIDNVPWDVTPTMLKDWLGSEMEALCHHVLVDRRDGRTLSYAYMEVSPQAMKAILRAKQNSILGLGKRARAVTITVASQEELMRQLFPTWKGNFNGSKPSVAGLSNTQISSVFREGLLSWKEIEDVLKLLRKPDSHFVKVPTLPYEHVMSILRKFPSDADSKVFRSPAVKDALFNFVQVSLEELRARVFAGGQHFTPQFLAAFEQAVKQTRVFTRDQRERINAVLSAAEQASTSETSSATSIEQPNPFSNPSSSATASSLYTILAKAHSLSPHTVQAIAKDVLALVGTQNMNITSTQAPITAPDHVV